MTKQPACELCGEPLEEAEAMSRVHGYLGPCPKPHLPRKPEPSIDDLLRQRDELADALETQTALVNELCEAVQCEMSNAPGPRGSAEIIRDLGAGTEAARATLARAGRTDG